MEQNNVGDANTSAPVQTGAHPFGDWLTVPEAVTYCVSRGLNRTPKTVRKWAQRSGSPDEENVDVVVRKQDTGNGFRWLIERTSLDIKIEQELDFEKHNGDENPDANTFEQVATGAHLFEQVQVEETSPNETRTDENTSEQVRTDAHRDDDIVDFLKRQIEVKDRQIDALLERDRETNILIQGLQSSLSGVVNALPSGRRDGDRSHVREVEHHAHQNQEEGEGDNNHEHRFSDRV